MEVDRAHWAPLSVQCVKLLNELRTLVPEDAVH